MVPLVPKLAVMTPGARVAGADGAHHVVAAAGADEHAGVQTQLLRPWTAAATPRAGRWESSGGSFPARSASIASSAAADHWRLRTSSSAVPLASPYSITFSPVSQKFR